MIEAKREWNYCQCDYKLANNKSWSDLSQFHRDETNHIHRIPHTQYACARSYAKTMARMKRQRRAHIFQSYFTFIESFCWIVCYSMSNSLNEFAFLVMGMNESMCALHSFFCFLFLDLYLAVSFSLCLADSLYLYFFSLFLSISLPCNSFHSLVLPHLFLSCIVFSALLNLSLFLSLLSTRVHHSRIQNAFQQVYWSVERFAGTLCTHSFAHRLF